MVHLLSETEGTPTAYPDAPADLSTEAAAVSADMIWRRIETWVRYRWAARTVTWVVEGPGTWVPPLRPATVTASATWDNGAWTDSTLTEAPLGYDLDGATYRITATVGEEGDPPETVLEAFRRLAEYLAGASGGATEATAETTAYGDICSTTVQRPPTWRARALQYSGAADLLREWRRSC